MKRIAALCTALLGALLFLTACKPQESAAPDEPAPTPYTESTQAALPFPVGKLYDLFWADYYSSPTGCNDGKAFYTLEQVFASEDATGTQQRSWLIMRIDYETRTQAPLCSLPGCTHESTDCPAFLCGIFGRERFAITLVEDQLYVLHKFIEDDGTEAPMTVWLDRAAMDGSGRRRLAEFPTNWMMEEEFPVTDGTALYGQYADLDDSSVHGVRVVLETGEITSFSFGLDDSETIFGTLEGQFLLRRTDNAILQAAYPGVMTPERDNVVLEKFGSLSANSLLQYNPTTGARTDLSGALAQCGLSSVPYYTFVQQGKFYYISTDDFTLPQYIWQVDLAGGTARMMAEFAPPSVGSWHSLEPLQLSPAGPDTVEPYVLGFYWNGQGNNYFLLDVRDCSIREIVLQCTYSNESGSACPIAQTDSGLWLIPVDSIPSSDPWRGNRYACALAEPETVLSGVGEVYPIQMWAFPEALG